MNIDFLKLKNLGDKFAQFAKIADKKLPDKNLNAVAVSRITDGAKMHIAAGLECPTLFVTSDLLAAKSVTEKLVSWGVDAVYVPERDDVLIHRKSFSMDNTRARISALYSLACGRSRVAVVTADGLMQRYPLPSLLLDSAVKVSVEDVVEPILLAQKLTAAGYTRQDMVAAEGEYALRGDIVDVYPLGGNPVRINFFDELVESVKEIDLDTMASLKELDCVTFLPASDILLDERSLVQAKSELSKYASSSDIAAEVEGELQTGANNPSLVWALPFLKGATSNIFAFMDYPLVLLDEPRVVADKLDIVQKEFDARISALSDGNEITPLHREALYSKVETTIELSKCRRVGFSTLFQANPLFNPTFLFEPKCRPVTKYYLDPKQLASDLKVFLYNKFKVLVCAGSREGAKGIINSLGEDGLQATLSEDGCGRDNLLVSPLSISEGVLYPDLKVLVIGYSECVGKRRAQTVIAQKTQFSAPKIGDYVVHRVHGVGICEGTTMLKTGEYEREFIVLRYRDGDTLYVASDQTDNLQKFVGGDAPKLNKIGGKEFEKEKSKVRSSVKKLAINLLQLYAKREKQKGFQYSADTVWQKEFEDAFPYTETADQLKAIEAVKNDMESGRIMDRIIVGDVGFGKTEVAFRAMFKTVLDNKQAVLLAPTTILARQHYENIVERLRPFGIRCALFSRLQSVAENNRTLKQLEDGTMSIVIATHKVLSPSVVFKDLGLLVLDEEQRFGVEHKEKLKEKYPLVNVLTLSATPIPRTLNMALSGVRDISMLETAPQGRLPVQTYVVDYSDALIRDAVTRECARGGQTFILLNDIENLDVFASKVRALTNDNARVITAHGQMPPKEIEERMQRFYDKQADVLVATTIIENGIDLPDANTLIVIDSGHFGLSQLYQLRGRVGRRGTLAHAYFTIPPSGVLSDTSAKRLQALLDNTEIGSGFKVAMSDLSIRGAGNLLGAEQHGHIEHVGYEMYIELLNEAVEELRTGEAHKEFKPVDMRVDATAFIRDGYVSSRDKLRVYKRIASVSSVAAKEELLKELADVYGKPDQALVNLIDISLIKNIVQNFDAKSVVINRNGAGVTFYTADVFKNETLMKAVADHSDYAVLTSTIPPTLVFDVKKTTAESRIKRVLDFFAETCAK